MNWRSALVTNCAVLFLFATGGSTVDAEAPEDVNACSLVTADQVSSVLGFKVGAGENTQKTFKQDCDWGKLPKIVHIIIEDKLYFDLRKNKKNIGSMPVTNIDVKGIGDDAYYELIQTGAGTAKMTATTLCVKKGNASLRISIFGFPDDQIKEKAKTLALNILAQRSFK